MLIFPWNFVFVIYDFSQLISPYVQKWGGGNAPPTLKESKVEGETCPFLPTPLSNNEQIGRERMVSQAWLYNQAP